MFRAAVEDADTGDRCSGGGQSVTVRIHADGAAHLDGQPLFVVETRINLREGG